MSVDCEHYTPPDAHGIAWCRGVMPMRDDYHCTRCRADSAFAAGVAKTCRQLEALRDGVPLPATSDDCADKRPLPRCPHRTAKDYCDKLARKTSACFCRNKCPVGFRPLSISVVIPTRDEGDQLIETVRSCFDSYKGIDEIVVVWDSPKDPPDPLKKDHDHPPFPRLRTLRNDKPIGVDPCRNRGAAAASGDVIVFLDAHMRISAQNLRELADIAFEKDCILQAASRGIGLDHTFLGLGTQFKSDGEFPLGLKWWSPSDKSDPLIPCEGLMGGCYVIPRHVWNKLGGFCRHTGLWGFSEEFLSLKCWFLDVPIFVHRDIHAQHWYRDGSSRPYFLDGTEVWESRIGGARVIFDDSTWNTVINPWLTSHALAGKVADILGRNGLDEERAAFQRTKRHSDGEFFEAHPLVTL